ncbi:15232_t:CDS:2 [Cetraspora pellucida]|uniref:15232_t:CDS:1 n=1 Tax=Cetraspora pellucida TaxID=1433469 RepID=A0A9N8VMC6_9GLOM|nr:15232_t:CDS:2 [Cetraspora pellucida]
MEQIDAFVIKTYDLIGQYFPSNGVKGKIEKVQEGIRKPECIRTKAKPDVNDLSRIALKLPNWQVLSQDSCHLSPTRPKVLVGYYPAYKLNLTLGVDFDISSSIDYLNYVAFGPNDLVNNGANLNIGGDPMVFFNSQSSKLYKLLSYKAKNSLNFKLILSILLPTDGNNLTKFFNKQPLDPIQGWYNPNSTQNTKFIGDLITVVNSFNFDGIDIDYPYKFPCSPSIGFVDSDFLNFINAISSRLGNKDLTITAGQYSIKGLNQNIVNFINIQGFHLNINNTYTSSGIDKISQMLNDWNFIDHSKLFLGVEFGGIVEIVTSNNIRSDIEKRNLQPVNDSNFQFPFANEPISDLCKYSSYAYLSWENLSEQPYLYRQQNSPSKYYVTFYEDYQSLSAKLDYIRINNLAGISIVDITKDSKDLQLTNFILRISGTSSKSQLNIGAIVGGVIGAIIFIGALAVGIVLYRRHKEETSISKYISDTTYSDTNHMSPNMSGA